MPLIKMCNIFDHHGIGELKLVIAFSFKNTQKKTKTCKWYFVKSHTVDIECGEVIGWEMSYSMALMHLLYIVLK